jgi:hypothetical protein
VGRLIGHVLRLSVPSGLTCPLYGLGWTEPLATATGIFTTGRQSFPSGGSDGTAAGVHPPATATGNLLQDAPIFEGTNQPAGGLEGDAQDLGQLTDTGHRVREEVVTAVSRLGLAPSLRKRSL